MRPRQRANAHTMKNCTNPTTRVDEGAYHALHSPEKCDHRREPKNGNVYGKAQGRVTAGRTECMKPITFKSRVMLYALEKI